MGFQKGHNRPGPGRPPGLPNKVTAALKDMILQALDDAGGVEYLRTQAEENPQAFLTLVGKVLPMQVTGGDGGPLTIVLSTGVPRQKPDEASADA